VIDRCLALEALNISGCSITHDTLQEILVTHDIRHLDIRDCNRLRAPTLFDDLHFCPNLIRLKLSGSEFSIETLIKILLDHPNLKFLNLDVTDFDCDELIEILEARPEMQGLELSPSIHLGKRDLQRIKEHFPNLEITIQREWEN
jgi:hypothetical protein